MEVRQPRRSTRLAPRVNSLQLSGVNSSNNESLILPSPDGVMVPAAPNEELFANDPAIQPKKKKAATSSSEPKSKLKRVRMLGKLSSLLSLPLDIFFEVASHLHPLDLLHLSRASRHFARMFLGTQNRHAWLAARRTVEGLPDCPSDLSEPQYAHLLFESICSSCGKIGKRLVFNLRVRFCASCYKVKVETHIMVDEVEDTIERMFQIVPHNYSVTHWNVVEYFGDQFQAIMDEFMNAHDFASRDTFVKKMQEAVSVLVDHGVLVSDFLDKLQERKEQEKMQLRVTRKLQIDARIMAMGYSRHEIPEASPVYQEEITKPKALTERVWRGMADRMSSLAASRREIFNEGLLARLREWVDVYRPRYFLDEWPNALNAVQTDVVVILLAEENAGIPFTQHRFGANRVKINAGIMAWTEKAKLEIVDKLADVYHMPRDIASLQSASAVIRCGECKQFLFASDVITHLHFCDNQSVLWAQRNWGFDGTLHQMARTLLHHAGLSFDVTSKQAKELEGKLACGCGKPTVEVPIGFLKLVAHLLQENWAYDETFKLRKLGGESLRCDNEQHATSNDANPSMAKGLACLEMKILTSSTSLHDRTAEGPVKDDDPCCRLCGEACYIQVDMRCKAEAKQHMEVKHGKAEILEEYLCPARDISWAAQDYVDAHGGQIIITRMAKC